jgi:hypothetical protein
MLWPLLITPLPVVFSPGLRDRSYSPWAVRRGTASHPPVKNRFFDFPLLSRFLYHISAHFPWKCLETRKTRQGVWLCVCSCRWFVGVYELFVGDQPNGSGQRRGRFTALSADYALERHTQGIVNRYGTPVGPDLSARGNPPPTRMHVLKLKLIISLHHTPSR